MIKSAAIKKGNTGEIFTGNSHGEILKNYCSLDDMGILDKQGFLTDTGKFLNRKEAAKHAIECNQVAEDTIKYGELYIYHLK